MYVYIYIHLCMYINIYIYKCVCVSLYAYIFIDMICVHLFTNIYIYMYNKNTTHAAVEPCSTHAAATMRFAASRYNAFCSITWLTSISLCT